MTEYQSHSKAVSAASTPQTGRAHSKASDGDLCPQTRNSDQLRDRSSQTIDGTATNRTTDGRNEVTAVGTSSLAYDNAGNTITDETGRHLTYDAWNHLASTSDSSNTLQATYTYDALGRRIATPMQWPQDIYYDNQWQVIEQRGSNDIKIQYVWSMAYIDAMVLRDRDSDGLSNTGNLGKSGSGLEERVYSQNDANYNTTSLLNDSGQVMERLKYDPYGAPTYMNSNFGTQSDQWSWLYLHQGGRLEWVSGTLNFRNRDYSPTLGRWIEQDPAGYVDGQNLYQYENSQATVADDPSGLFAINLEIAAFIPLSKGVKVLGSGHPNVRWGKEPMGDLVPSVTRKYG